MPATVYYIFKYSISIISGILYSSTFPCGNVAGRGEINLLNPLEWNGLGHHTPTITSTPAPFTPANIWVTQGRQTNIYNAEYIAEFSQRQKIRRKDGTKNPSETY